MFHRIELAWTGLQNYVREQNTNFHLSDVGNLIQTWMASLDTFYLDHARNIENTFKKADRFQQQIEEEIIDEEDKE